MYYLNKTFKIKDGKDIKIEPPKNWGES